MKIDEAAFSRMLLGRGYPENGDEPRGLRELIEAYLAALPSAEPGRDRIALSQRELHWIRGALVSAMRNVRGGSRAHAEFETLLDRLRGLSRPAEPVEVEGSVEGVS